ncbi:MAG: CDP-diacylglycerol--glycerol-3-phosphate 3-phosphatidyltransferase [Nitrospinae bacterium]|nr:CDP-diacylglycerol--glycerol-3-phosphate 3-phosphatidyltransferase [Nitrospinota bacterium]
MNLPNKLTLFRIFVVPLIIVFLIKPSPLYSFLAAVVFTIAAITDWLDGHLARSTGQVTALGKLLDPIADKILIVSVLVPLVGIGSVPAWLATIIIGRELAVSGIRAVAASEKLIIPAGTLGKYKTVFEIAAIEFLLLNWDFDVINFKTIGNLLLFAAVALSLTSATNYFLLYWRSREGRAA